MNAVQFKPIECVDILNQIVEANEMVPENKYTIGVV
jgi:hypothetical protein